MRNQNLLVRWCYNSEQWYNYYPEDSIQAGKIYRLKVLENEVLSVEVWLDKQVVISWNKQGD